MDGGTNIGPYPEPRDLDLLDRVAGVRALRFPPRLDSDDRWFVSSLLGRGITPWLVLDLDGLGADPRAALSVYRSRHLYQGVVWQIGNEPDLSSPSSWTMGQDEFSGLLGTAREVLGPDAYIVAGGLASGNPFWLDGVELDQVNAIAVHPYGKWPTGAPVRGGWGFGPVSELLQGYRDVLDRKGLSDRAIHVTEYGAPRSDLTDEVFREYIPAMTAALADSGLVGTALQFCLSDRDVPPFGLFTTEDVPMADLGLSATPTQAPPEFVLGFADWAASDPDLIGAPLDNEWGAARGISQQRTTNGVLTWADLKSGQVMTFFDLRDGQRYRWEGGQSRAA